MKDARSHLKEGQEYYFGDLPDYVSAEQCFRKAIAVAPDWGESFLFLAGALQRQNKLKQACEMGRTAVRLLPGDPRPLIDLGNTLLLSGRHAAAVHSLEDGLKLKPHYGEADARCMLAEAFERLGNIKRAAVTWRQIANMESTYPSHDRPMEEAKKKLAKHGLSLEDHRA